MARRSKKRPVKRKVPRAPPPSTTATSAWSPGPRNPATWPAGAPQRAFPPGPRPLDETVQLKLRFSEYLRRHLELAAKTNARSMNAEIISRLTTSFIEPDRISQLVADALLEGLD